MHISLSEAPEQLDELVRLAESGEDVTLTRNGRPIAKLVQIDAAERAAMLDRLKTSLEAKSRPGPSAARSQDFLYGDDGLPA